MCGRFVIASSPQILVDRFGVQEETVGAFEPDYNVTPRAEVPVVRERLPRHGAPGDSTRVLSRLRWGLVPSWAASPAIGDRMINARAETVSTKNAYKAAFRKRRCIVPADAFYEWKKVAVPGVAKPARHPYVVRRRDGEPLAFAGIWEIWRNPVIDDQDAPDAWLRTYAIVTTRANALVAPVHDRMPVVLGEDVWDRWLDPTIDDVATLESFLVPAPDVWLETYEVGTRVNSPRNNDAALLEPLARET